MTAMNRYFDGLREVLNQVEKTQGAAIEKAARIFADATIKGNNIFAFGCSHAALVTLEMYYRTGGMANINPVRAPGLCLDIDPATMTSQMERLPGYGGIIVDALPMNPGDVMLIHSVSGRNAVSIDAAYRAKERGAYVIALTNLNTSTAVTPRHPGGKNLYQIADLVIDNCGALGDASLVMDGLPEKVAPTSTAIGAAIVNAIVAQAVEYIVNSGVMPPVFVSANLDHGDDHNRVMMEQYGDHIFYM